MLFLAIIIFIIIIIIIDVIRADTGAFFLKNILHAYRYEMYHFSDGSPCGIEWSTNLPSIGFCLDTWVSPCRLYISPQMFHSLRQESVDAVDPCDTAVVREILISLLEVTKREVLFLMCYSCVTNIKRFLVLTKCVILNSILWKIISVLNYRVKKVKQSRYRPGVARRVPGS